MTPKTKEFNIAMHTILFEQDELPYFFTSKHETIIRQRTGKSAKRLPDIITGNEIFSTFNHECNRAKVQTDR